MAKHKYSKEEVAEWRKTHNSFFYFNKDDANLTVPKAYTFGWTFNWAHPVSWGVGVLIIALVVYLLFIYNPAA